MRFYQQRLGTDDVLFQSDAERARAESTTKKSKSTRPATKVDDFFLPDFCNWRALLSIASICLLVALIVGLLRWQRSADPLLELLLIIVFLLWIALGCAAALCFARPILVKLQRYTAILVTYFLIVGLTVVISSLSWFLLDYFDALLLVASTSRGYFILNNLGIAVLVTTIGLRYLFVLHQWRQRIQSEAEAKMQSLMSRIRPHFLFNTMNTIACLTRIDAEAAEGAIEDLAELLRVTMRQSDQLVPLAEELEVCRCYARVEQLRMGDRLRVDWQLDAAAESCLVPTLSIQPLLENAVKHGAEHLHSAEPIKVRVEFNKHLVITVENPFDATLQTLSPSGMSIALDNIKQRLQLSYGEQAKLLTSAQNNWFVVQLHLPAKLCK